MRLTDPATGAAVGKPFGGHTHRVETICTVEVDGRTLLATGSGDSTVRLWDPRAATPVGLPLACHGPVIAACTLRLDGRTLLATVAGNAVQLWDPITGIPVGAPLTGHDVSAVCTLQLDGRTLLVTGGGDSTVRLWDPRSGAPVGEPLVGHTEPIKSVCAFDADSRTLIASAGVDATILVWAYARRVGDRQSMTPADGNHSGRPLRPTRVGSPAQRRGFALALAM